MLFGLCNAPATYQYLIELVLAGLHWTTCLVYLDDIIVFCKNLEKHFLLQEVFEKLRNAALKVKPQKCQLFVSKYSIWDI